MGCENSTANVTTKDARRALPRASFDAVDTVSVITQGSTSSSPTEMSTPSCDFLPSKPASTSRLQRLESFRSGNLPCRKASHRLSATGSRLIPRTGSTVSLASNRRTSFRRRASTATFVGLDTTEPDASNDGAFGATRRRSIVNPVDFANTNTTCHSQDPRSLVRQFGERIRSVKPLATSDAVSFSVQELDGLKALFKKHASSVSPLITMGQMVQLYQDVFGGSSTLHAATVKMLEDHLGQDELLDFNQCGYLFALMCQLNHAAIVGNADKQRQLEGIFRQQPWLTAKQLKCDPSLRGKSPAPQNRRVSVKLNTTPSKGVIATAPSLSRQALGEQLATNLKKRRGSSSANPENGQTEDEVPAVCQCCGEVIIDQEYWQVTNRETGEIFYLHDGECLTSFQREQSPKCAHCSQPITGDDGVTMDGENYHEACADAVQEAARGKCDQCGKCLPESYYQLDFPGKEKSTVSLCDDACVTAFTASDKGPSVGPCAHCHELVYATEDHLTLEADAAAGRPQPGLLHPACHEPWRQANLPKCARCGEVIDGVYVDLTYRGETHQLHNECVDAFKVKRKEVSKKLSNLSRRGSQQVQEAVAPKEEDQPCNPLTNFCPPVISVDESLIAALEQEERTLSQLAMELTASCHTPFQLGLKDSCRHAHGSLKAFPPTTPRAKACDLSALSVISLGQSCIPPALTSPCGALSLRSLPNEALTSPSVRNPLEAPPTSPLAGKAYSCATVDCGTTRPQTAYTCTVVQPFGDEADAPLSPLTLEREVKVREAVDRLAKLNNALKQYDYVLDTKESSSRCLENHEAEMQHTAGLKERVRSLRIKIGQISSVVGICPDCAPVSPSLIQCNEAFQCAVCKRMVMADLPQAVETPTRLMDLRKRKMSTGW